MQQPDGLSIGEPESIEDVNAATDTHDNDGLSPLRDSYDTTCYSPDTQQGTQLPARLSIPPLQLPLLTLQKDIVQTRPPGLRSYRQTLSTEC